ncbi:MAG: ATP-binding cassette domain-containing protein [Clostridia bacterium]|nr:ATP-binding cassette domain-containing protein [Clostridia bacterium]
MRSEQDIAIQITNLKKMYRLGTIGGGTLQGDIQSWWARVRGKEDPNSKIGSKAYKKNESFMALDGIDLTVYKGERLGIIGHNGAGKSTLLKLLSRVTGPTEGEIKIDGRISSMLEVGTGFNGELTGRENIYLNGAILGMTKAEIDRKIDQIIDFSEVRQFIDTPVKRYSSGMYVKLAFAVASHLDSEILIMDEVLAVGDMAFQKKCLDKMSQVSQDEGRTILYVSHNMNTIRQLCDRCIVMDHGKIIYNGEVEEAIEIYLGLIEISKQIIDLTHTQRTKRCSEGIKLQSIELASHDKWQFAVGEKIQFKLTLKSTKALQNIGFRMRVSCADNTSVSMLLAPKLITCEENQQLSVALEADISQLAPGKYYLTPSLYETTDVGTQDFYDHMNNAVIIEILATENFNENMEWESRWWGNIMLPPLKKVD